jgi:IS66 C-terminal element
MKGSALGRDRIADRNLQANAVDPQAYLADALTKLVNDWPMSRIDELLPWAYVTFPRAAVA